MTNNIAVSITADVADLTAKRAIASTELKALQKDLNDLAKTARDGGMTDELKARMLALGDGVATAKSQVSQIDTQLKTFGRTANETGAAVGGLHAGTAGVTRELLVMGREASRGNLNRLAGSATILAGRLGLLTPQILMVVGGVLALAAPVVLVAAAMESAANDAAKYQGALSATANYAGLTAASYRDMTSALAVSSHIGLGEARKELLDLINTGKFSGAEMLLIGKDSNAMSEMTGESADKMLSEFEKMGDDVAKFAREYQDHYHQLTTAQFEHIEALQKAGDVEGAQMAFLQAVYGYLGNQAPRQVGALKSAWDDLTIAIGGAVDAEKNYVAGQGDTAATQIAKSKAALSELYGEKLRQQHGDDVGISPGLLDERIAGGEKMLASQQALAAATAKTAQDERDKAKAQTEGVDAAAKLNEQFEASKTSGEKLKKTLADINLELARATAADPGNKALYEQEAAAARSQAVKSDTPHAAKPKNDEVQVWQEELQTKLEDEKAYFGDSKAEEQKFWTDKLALTTAGSSQQRAVKTKLYDLDRDLARQAYADQLASLNDRLEADRGNWSKQQAEWATKLAFIKASYGAQSSEYTNAQREEEAAEREHRSTMAQIQRDAEATSVEQLKSTLAANKTIRDEDARTQEAVTRAKGSGSPVGEIQAAVQIAAQARAARAADLADTATTYQAENALLQAAVARATVSYGTDSKQYADALKAKQEADQAYYDKRRVMEDQATQQSIRDAQDIQQKWMGITQPIGSAMSGMFQGMALHQQTFSQAALKAGDQLLFKFIDVEVQDLEKWTATQLAKTGLIKTQSTMQGLAQAAAASNTAVTQKAADLAAVTGYAGVAAAATFAAYSPEAAADPALPGEMAAAAYGQAMSMGSFAKGIDVVPRNMIAQIHAGERIMPAADNSAIMDAVGAGKGGGRGGASVNNTFNNNFHGVSHDPHELVSAMMPLIMERFEKMKRRGMLG